MGTNSQAAVAVVVGGDRSWGSQNAVLAATREASRRGCELVLLSVVETPRFWSDGLAWTSRSEVEATLEAHVAADLALAQVVAADPAVPVRTIIVKDLDSPELGDLAGQAGLLVLGRHGDGGQGAFSLGTVSTELMRGLHCPILVVHEQGRTSQSRRFVLECAVFVGMDTIGGAGAVLSVAVREAVIRQMSLFVVHALPDGTDADATVIERVWRRCRAALQEAQFPADVPVHLVITQGDPARALLQRVGPGDLLVVGTPGQGRLAGLVNGSVSSQILDQMTCDVMVVPPGSTAPAWCHQSWPTAPAEPELVRPRR